MLIAEDITFGYDDATPIIECWNQAFPAGEMVAITGPSGRGKSTLLYLLGLMLGPQSGTVLIDGEVVSQGSDVQRAWLRATAFGFVFQDSALDATRSVLDNVTEGALYRHDSRREVESTARSLLDQFGVALRAEAKPAQVSGGQAQRIALCRALLHDPAIVLADEPTGNLDATSRDIVIAALRDQAGRGSAVVIVTHDESVASRCDRVISL